MSEDTAVLSQSDQPDGPRRRGGLVTVLVAAAVVLLLVVGGAAFAAWRVLGSHGPRPDEVLPVSTIALASVDLDPGAGQKVAAFKTMRKFPAWRKDIGANSDDDLLRKLVDKLHKGGDCKSLDYEKDLDPWLGRRAAFGAVDLGKDKIAPVIAVQTTDADKAKTGFDKLLRCSGGSSDVGFTVTDDYVVASDSNAHAKQIAAAGAKKPLSEDSDYQRWSKEVGGHGVLDFYVAAAAKDQIKKEMASSGNSPLSGSPEIEKSVDDALKNFRGMAGSLLFKDGGMTLALASSAAGMDTTTKAGAQVAELPADTAAVLAISVPTDTSKKFSEMLTSSGADELFGDLESTTGLRLPEDLTTLLGSALSISIGGAPPADLKEISGPKDLDAALQITGDPEKINELIGRLEQKTGSSLSEQGVVHKDKGDRFVLATNDGYADKVLAKGSLGDQDRFKEAVPDADQASSVFYLDLDGKWAVKLLDELKSQGKRAAEAHDNLVPIKSIGMRAWTDKNVGHAEIKVSLD